VLLTASSNTVRDVPKAWTAVPTSVIACAEGDVIAASTLEPTEAEACSTASISAWRTAVMIPRLAEIVDRYD